MKIYGVGILVKSDYIGVFGIFCSGCRFFFYWFHGIFHCAADVDVVQFFAGRKSISEIGQHIAFIEVCHGIAKIKIVSGIGQQLVFPLNQDEFVAKGTRKYFFYFFNGRRDDEVFAGFLQRDVFVEIQAQFLQICRYFYSGRIDVGVQKLRCQRIFFASHGRAQSCAGKHNEVQKQEIKPFFHLESFGKFSLFRIISFRFCGILCGRIGDAHFFF